MTLARVDVDVPFDPAIPVWMLVAFAVFGVAVAVLFVILKPWRK